MDHQRLSIHTKIQKQIENVRIDGVPNILRAHFKIWKTVWFLIFVSSSIISCYLIVESAHEYLKYQVTTSYRLASQEGSPFPTVNICNVNALNSEFFIQKMNEANLLESIEADPIYNMIALERYHLQTTGQYLTSEEKRAMFDMEGFIISCTFRNKPCNMSDFRYLFLPYFLNCLQFNSGYDSDGKPVKMRQLAPIRQFNELKMEFYVGLPNVISSSLVNRGIKIGILRNSESPFKNTPSLIQIKPGLGLKLSVEKKRFIQFNQCPYLYSECLVNEDNQVLKQLDDMSFINKVTENTYSYSKDSCLLYCFNYFMSQVCNCSEYSVRWKIEGFDYCLGEQGKCSDDFYYTNFNVGNFIEDNCLSRCPMECDIHRFDNRQSFYRYPDPVYVKNTLQNNEMLISRYSNQTDFTENLASNVVKFSVSYDAMVYAEAKEEAKISWDAFLGTIGCHLHLFLGMSAISFVEIVDLIFKVSIYNFGYSKV